MLQVTEDTPPDMLAGAMDLTVHLPSGHPVRMSVERSTPMMDLLVQITAKHQLQLSGYTLQALSMAPWSDEYDKVLPYKPNTPIGTLDTQHVKVVAKSRSHTFYKKSSPGHQPFESTFRLKVFLPRNQLFVTRVHTDVHLEQIMRKVCEEKCLDPKKYEFRHPGNLDETLDPKLTLSDYQITEIYLVAKGVTNFSQVAAAANVTVMRKEEEVKQMHNKTGGGVFNLIFRRGKAKNETVKKESSVPTESSEQCPKVPQRKRRPAPKPPSTSPGSSSIQENQRDEETAAGSSISETDSQVRKTDTSLLICHSRNSSDSSGYHEASVLSENNASLPRRPKSALVTRETEGLSKMYSQSVTNLTKISSKPSTSLGVPARKKKPAPPPPPLRASSTALSTETPVSDTSSQQVDNTDESLSCQQPYDSIVSCHAAIAVTKNEHNNCFGSTDSGIAQETLEKSVESDPSYTVPVVPAPSSVPPEPTKISPLNTGVGNISPEPSTKLETAAPSMEQELDTIDWQYQLPSPPKPFKDTESLADDTLLSKDVGVPYSELFEKLKNVEEVRAESEVVTSQSDSTTDDTSANGKSSTLTSSTGSTIDDSAELQIKHNNVVHEKEPVPHSSSNTNSSSDISEYRRKSSAVSSRSNSTLDNLSDISESTFAVKEQEQRNLEISEAKKNMISPIYSHTHKYSSKSSITDIVEDRKNTVSPIHKLDQSDSSKRSSLADIGESIKSISSPIHSQSQSSSLADIGEIGNSRASPIHSQSQSSSLADIGESRNSRASPIHNQSQSSSLADIGESRKSRTSPIHSQSQSDSSKRSNIADIGESRNIRASPIHIQIQSSSLANIGESRNSRASPIHSQSQSSSLADIGESRNSRASPIHSQTQSSSLADIGDSRNSSASPIHSQSQSSSIADISESRKSKSSPIHSQNESSSLANIGESRNSRSSPIHSQSQSDSSELSNIADIGESRKSTINKLPSEPSYYYLNSSGNPLETVGVKKNGVTTDECRRTSMANEMQDRRSSPSLYTNQQRTSMSTNSITVCNAAPNSSPSMNDEEKKSSPSSYSKLQNSSPSPAKQNKTPSPPPVKFIQRRFPVNTLPNFKISTYNEPKQNITVFEDDTIRSNASRPSSMYNAPNISKKYFGGSFQDLHANSTVENNRVDEGPSTNFNSLNSVSRSESFSSDNVRLRPKPVSRSKSHINLKPNRWRRTEDLFEEEMYKSNSLYDLSGLQSLEVMRLIQNKLTTSTSSIDRIEDQKPSRIDRSNTFNDRHSLNSNLSTKDNGTSSNQIRYSYQIQPSLKMGTWSDRPKVTINSKPSDDYTLKQRPHSMAFPQDFDTSRVPVVRSVELKKHFKANKLLSAEGEANINPKEPVLDLGNNISRISNNKETPNFVSRVNIFKTPSAPIVRGFKNSPNTFEFKERKVSPSNRNSVVESSIQTGNRYNTYLNGIHRNGDIPQVKSPPKPPAMPKDNNHRLHKPVKFVDTRDQLLEEIRNFGGKKGFRTAQM